MFNFLFKSLHRFQTKMEDIDPSKPVDIEKLSNHEYYLHVQRIRDTASQVGAQSQKQIDRMTVGSHAVSFITAGNHLRAMSEFDHQFKPYVPDKARDPLVRGARKVFDSVRKDWVMSLTKVRDGVSTAEQFYTANTPGMSKTESQAYRKVLKDTKGKSQGGGHGTTPKKMKFGRGGFNNNRGGGHNRNFPSGGGGDFGGSFDPFNQGEKCKFLQDRNEDLEKSLKMLVDQNTQKTLIIRSLQLQSVLMAMKLDAFRTELFSLLNDIKITNSGSVPYQPSYYKDSSSVGPPQYGGGGYNSGGGNHHGGFGRGGRGGYRGNNYRGGGGAPHTNQGGDRGGFGGNHGSGGGNN